jgi:hypothetical protein
MAQFGYLPSTSRLLSVMFLLSVSLWTTAIFLFYFGKWAPDVLKPRMIIV